jgi:hypothetical protein
VGIFAKLASAFGIVKIQRKASSPAPSQALIVNFDYGLKTPDRLFALDEKLQEHFSDVYPIEYDGNEFATDLSGGTFYFYGPDADALLDAVLPQLKPIKFMEGARLTRRYGEAGDRMAREDTTIL